MNKRYLITFINLIMMLIFMKSINVNARERLRPELRYLNKHKLLAEIPEEKISLYALDSLNENGYYNKILLNIKGNEKQFNWKVYSNEECKVRLILSDINEDKNKELVVITTKEYEANNRNIEEAHVFSLDTLEEIEVKNPEDDIGRYISKRVYRTDDTIIVSMNIEDIRFNITSEKLNEIYKKSTYKKWDTINFGDYRSYDVINNELICKISCDIFQEIEIGDIIVPYWFINNKLEPSSPMDFKPSNKFQDMKISVLLADLPDECIFLYALDSDIGTGEYKDILLKVKGKEKKFHWHVDSGLSFRPEITLSDINSDNKKELVIIITTGTGTGIYTQEVHIFNIDTLEEIKVENPLDIVSKNVKTKINKEVNSVTIDVEINGEKMTINNEKLNELYNGTSKEEWPDKIYFGNKINYEIANGKLSAKLGGNTYDFLLIGEIIIEYKFKDNMLVDDNIKFDVYKEF